MSIMCDKFNRQRTLGLVYNIYHRCNKQFNQQQGKQDKKNICWWTADINIFDNLEMWLSQLVLLLYEHLRLTRNNR